MSDSRAQRRFDLSSTSVKASRKGVVCQTAGDGVLPDKEASLCVISVSRAVGQIGGNGEKVGRAVPCAPVERTKTEIFECVCEGGGAQGPALPASGLGNNPSRCVRIAWGLYSILATGVEMN